MDTVLGRADQAIDEVLGLSGSRLDYVYDFGASTELVVSHSGVIEAAPEQDARVVARNEAPAWPCDVCGRPASMVCVECVYVGAGGQLTAYGCVRVYRRGRTRRCTRRALLKATRTTVP